MASHSLQDFTVRFQGQTQSVAVAIFVSLLKGDSGTDTIEYESIRHFFGNTRDGFKPRAMHGQNHLQDIFLSSSMVGPTMGAMDSPLK